MPFVYNFAARAGRKLERVARRVVSLAVKKSALSHDDFDSLIATDSDFKSTDAYIAALLRDRTTITVRDHDRIHRLVRNCYRDVIDCIITRADDALSNKFRVLGFDPVSFGDRIKWGTDFVVDVSWANDYYLSAPIVIWNNESDVKLPWELSRGHYLVWLAQAWQHTQESKYAKKTIALIDDWIESNPYPYGINWTCPMEAAIRMVNWITSIEILNHTGRVDIDFAKRFYRNVYQHAVYIEENIEVIGDGMNSNHYLANLLGLLLAGHLFADLPRGRFWKRFAVDELEKELFVQTLPDGFCYESSLNYQILTSEIYLIAYLVESRHDGFSESYRKRLRDMFRLTSALIKPDGCLPNFGDGDSGRTLVFDAVDRQNPITMLDFGALALDLPELRSSAKRPPYDSLWLCGPEVQETLKSVEDCPRKVRSSALFRSSGLATLRKDDLYLFFGANPIGSGGSGGHKHNDMLTVDISCGLTNFVIDSGTYRYTSNQSVRNRFRSTEYHSVPSVKGIEQNRFIPRVLFAIRPDAKVSVRRWESNDSYDFIEAEHTAYTRLSNPLLISRSIYFDKNERLWIFRDRFDGRGQYDLVSSLILGDVIPQIHDSKRISLNSKVDDSTLDIITFSDGWLPEVVAHEVSPEYGARREAEKLVFSYSGSGPVEMLWAAMPHRGEQEDVLTHRARAVLRVLSELELNRIGRTGATRSLTLKRRADKD
ncbi:MAG: alginate lyase family protein [Candidatus Zixiibacteriota bacterium]